MYGRGYPPFSSNVKKRVVNSITRIGGKRGEKEVIPFNTKGANILSGGEKKTRSRDVLISEEY